MKVAIAGGTGFIGGHLANELLRKKDELIIVSRSERPHAGGAGVITWNRLESSPELLEGLDAFVNLSGESINQRWSDAAKRRILESRIDSARRVAALVEKLEKKPAVVVNGSGMSIYGTSESDMYDENSPHRIVDFLSGVVEKWEQAIDTIRGTRVVKLRVGLVLGADGGALPKMALPYKLWAGGRIGSGKQWMSWIHIHDMVRLIEHCIARKSIHGPVNATAPHPVTNDDFGRTLGRVLGRPHWMPLPTFVFRTAFGELSTLLLDGQHVTPRTALEDGFRFDFERLDPALRDLYARQQT